MKKLYFADGKSQLVPMNIYFSIHMHKCCLYMDLQVDFNFLS